MACAREGGAAQALLAGLHAALRCAALYLAALGCWAQLPVGLPSGRHARSPLPPSLPPSLPSLPPCQAWYREGRAAEGLKRWEDAATSFYQAAQLQPDNEEFIRLTKEAIVEGRKEFQAQQAAQQQQQQQAVPAAAAAGEP